MTTQAPLGFPRRGTALSRTVARRLLRLAGWRVEGELPNRPQFVVIVAPHTSNWDFFIGILGMFATGLRASWLGKHPVDRSSPQGIVGTAVERFRTRSQWVLGLSPEGTRRRVDQWKTGFYRIAVGAGVAIVPVAIDYGRRALVIGSPVVPGPDEALEVANLRARFRKEMAKHPERFAEAPHQP